MAGISPRQLIRPTHLLLATVLIAITAIGQTATPPAKPNPFLNRKSPQDPLPGVIARGYLGGDHPPLKMPTPIIAIIENGDEFFNTVQKLMEDELRGTMDITRIEYTANGFILLQQDTDVAFDIRNMICNIDGKDYGVGQYTKNLKKGKHKLELIRRGWNDGAPKFSITDHTSKQSVVFHTTEELTRELAHSIKAEGKTMKTKLVGAVTE